MSVVNEVGSDNLGSVVDRSGVMKSRTRWVVGSTPRQEEEDGGVMRDAEVDGGVESDGGGDTGLERDEEGDGGVESDERGEGGVERDEEGDGGVADLVAMAMSWSCWS